MGKKGKQTGLATSRASFFTFDPTKIFLGDILLSTSPKSIKSAAIRARTKSDFSHAAIATEPGIFIEAIPAGVKRFNIQRKAVRDPRNVRLLRLSPKVANAQKTAARAANIAERYLSREYWLEGLISFVLPISGPEPDYRFFCSQLVAHAYLEAGCQIVANIKPKRVSPGDLERSRVLNPVKDSLLLRPVNYSGFVDRSFIEDEDETTPHHLEVKAMQSIYRRISQIYPRYGIEEPIDFFGALHVLATIREPSVASAIDREFVNILREEDYLSIFETWVMATGQHTLRLDEYVAKEIEGKRLSARTDLVELLEFYKQAASDMPNQCRRREKEAKYWRDIYRNTGLNTFHALGTLYEKLSTYQSQVKVTIDRAIKHIEIEIEKSR